jgi:hypothetical protein
MPDSRPRVTQEDGVWVVRVERTGLDGKKLQEYRCASEAQARQLEQALLPKPQ